MKKLIFFSWTVLLCSVVYSQSDPKALPITVKPSPTKTLDPKQTGTNLPITVKPAQNNTVTPQNTTSLPITVKGDSLAPSFNSTGSKTLDPKQDPNNLPITVKPGTNALPITVKPANNSTAIPQASASLPITVKTDPKALPITVKPGDKLFIANFAQDSLGELPALWKTDGMGELKLMNGEKWLRINEATTYETGLKTTFPENFKVEFDVIANFKTDQAVPSISITLYEKGERYREPGIWFNVQPNGGTASVRDRVQLSIKGKNGSDHHTAPAQLVTNFFDNNNQNIPVHVTLSVNKQNVKAWINDAKVYDAREVLPENLKINRLGFETSSYGGPRVNYDYYISNIQVTAL